ncbi:hypothetical protein [Streptomyces parvus]|uniref:Uncharacterized protein n=1 Tax=Streptomyces parvus TaxID=66428 RepID=A0A7K3SAN1_9ACTN|nr:hypothetical protein [Streptomyces parvus]NEC24595.1 hypothetical protein [Streptomyces parvus]
MSDRGGTALIRSAVSRLAALTGSPPEIVDEPDAVRIEADVTEVRGASWDRLLSVLESGGTYGLRTTPTRTTAWLRVPRDTGPRSGHGHGTDPRT